MGRIPRVQLGRRTIRFSPEDVQRVLLGRTCALTSSTAGAPAAHEEVADARK